MPIAVQRMRTKGWRMPENTMSVARPAIFGNPFPADVYGPARATGYFRRWLLGEMSMLELSQMSRCDRWSDGPDPISLVYVRSWLISELPRLVGKNLACYCRLPEPGQKDHCHRSVLIEIVNGPLLKRIM